MSGGKGNKDWRGREGRGERIFAKKTGKGAGGWEEGPGVLPIPLGKEKEHELPVAPLNPSRLYGKNPSRGLGFHSNLRPGHFYLEESHGFYSEQLACYQLLRKKKGKIARLSSTLVRCSPLQRVMSLPAKTQRKIQRGSDPVWLVSKNTSVAASSVGERQS